MDELDYRILQLLQADASQSYRTIAKRLKVAEGTVYNRVRAMQRGGVLKGTTVDVAYAKLGYIMTAIIGLRIRGGHLGEIEDRLAKDPNVLAVYDVTGEYDAVVIVKCRTREELNGFVKRLSALPFVERTYTMLALDVIKEAPGIPVVPPRAPTEPPEK